MAITVEIKHATTYRYDRPVTLSPHVVRLRPAPHTRTPIESYRLTVRPANHFINWQQDPFGNFLTRLVFPERTDHLEIEVDLVARMVAINPFDFFLDEAAEHFPFHYDALTGEELSPYLAPREATSDLMEEWFRSLQAVEGPTVAVLVDITRRLQRELAYEVRMEPGVQSCDETLHRRAGSCRDSAWLLVETLRRLGLAARFVSGYLIQLVADQAPLEGPAGPEADFTDLHAWAEVFLPGAGWFGLDPTSGLATAEGHIPLACAPTPVSAAPISGLVDQAQVSFEHSNSVRRIHEPPRVTLPYTDAQWADIDALGEKVDRILIDGDVRLTMGGEPTFVSVEDMDADEWNTDADGPTKRTMAMDLTRRLWDRFAHGAVLHAGQGKWYPGEPLPRWQFSLVWSVDGEPLWSRRELLADPDADLGHGGDRARAVAGAIASELGIDPDLVIDAYEDPVYNLWREASLPVDIDPSDAGLLTVDGRTDLLDALERGLGRPVGHVIPLDVDPASGSWRTSRWPLRRSHLFAVPGASPLGFRLPLDTLPAESETASERRYPTDPFAQPPPLPSGSQPARVAADLVVRTALTVEARGGVVRVFLPPLPDLPSVLDLLRRIERAAAGVSTPVAIEGYPIPYDQRLKRIAVTPDPGVIEVNIHPSSSWRELVDVARDLYEDARSARLGTEKFQLDGRHSGSGGGNHITVGGPTPADSPLLRRPSLLTSLITYWQHHPSLSYLFSGLFVGPTSQAPRIDEARHESLHELEIAIAELNRHPDPRPWLADRALRHLLTDLTGNTHRAEFCIDKLFSPDSATGRLGLLELRGFEMPPHWQMAAVQALLIRSLIGRFWNHPYHRRLIRWGSELHDRFMLPHYISEDVHEVVDDLMTWGIDFDPAWLDPFVEFRFPVIGAVRVGDIELELRTAIEPWPVLGEEVTAFGTARYVDSSMERLQVRAVGMTEGRHVIVCNGRMVPLRPTGVPGELVGGVRYRAWQPPSALHPTIGVDTPLTLHIVDLLREASLGGCTYHVSHPGGRAYEVFPVNALEAEARRSSRFEPHRHVEQAPVEPPLQLPAGDGAGPGVRRVVDHPEGELTWTPTDLPESDMPHTLDMRRPG